MDEMDIYLKKTMGFKPNTDYISREGITFLKNLGEYGERSKWISQACDLMFNYEQNRKGFFVRLIDLHFKEIRELVRKIGSARQKAHESMGEYWDGN